VPGARAGYLAVRPLARALDLAPQSAAVLSELVTALEQDGQHARAVAVLEEHEPVMGWVHRFQYVYNVLMAGSLDKAADGFGRLPEPRDGAWTPAREKVRRMLARARHRPDRITHGHISDPTPMNSTAGGSSAPQQPTHMRIEDVCACTYLCADQHDHSLAPGIPVVDIQPGA